MHARNRPLPLCVYSVVKTAPKGCDALRISFRKEAHKKVKNFEPISMQLRKADTCTVVYIYLSSLGDRIEQEGATEGNIIAKQAV